MTHLLYVTIEDCHFCEHRRAVLDELHVDRRKISVDSSEAEELADSGIPLGFLPVLTDGMHGGHGKQTDDSRKPLDELKHERDLLNEEIGKRAERTGVQ